MTTFLDRSRGALVVVCLAAAALAACSSVEVSTGGESTGVPADGGTAPVASNPTTTEPGAPGEDDRLAQAYVDALVGSFSPEGQEPFTQESIECLAPRWVEAIGVETFQQAGVTPEGLADDGGILSDLPIPEPVAEQMVDAVVGCGVELLSFAVQSLPSAMRDDPEVVACVRDTVAEEEVRAKMIEAMSSDGPGGSLRDLVEQCIQEHTPTLPPPSSTIP